MTSRQTGRKISRIYSGRTGSRGAVRRKKEQMTSLEKRRLAQFLVCGTVFVALVAAKLLLPGRVQQLGRRVNGVMEKNMDVTEVFSAVGRAFAGEEAGWDDVYRSVFHPEEPEAAPTAAARDGASQAVMRTLDSSDGWLTVPAMDLPPAPEKTAAETAPEEQPDVQQLSYILYSGETLPDNVSMEQRVLGFDYCTPVAGPLSSDFGYREHPIAGEERFHYGVDLAADEGAAIGCFADGTVTAAGESSSYGKYVIVAHPGDFSTLYAHCSKITAAAGTAVKEGQKIAEIGQTGQATGPHLHFEVHAGSVYLNPIYYVSPL